jgi:hypothetical protein
MKTSDRERFADVVEQIRSARRREATDPLVWCAAFRHRMRLSVRNREEPCPKCEREERGE